MDPGSVWSSAVHRLFADVYGRVAIESVVVGIGWVLSSSPPSSIPLMMIYTG